MSVGSVAVQYATKLSQWDCRRRVPRHPQTDDRGHEARVLDVIINELVVPPTFADPPYPAQRVLYPATQRALSLLHSVSIQSKKTSTINCRHLL